MIRRQIKDFLLKSASQYPVVLVHGPRQSGKTTLCRDTFADKPYISLENPDTRERALQDPRGFFKSIPNGAILDEIQNVPHLLSYMQQIVDESNQKGLFIITGSNNFALQQAVTQTLAGRVAMLKLLPFSLDEIKELNASDSIDSLILSGGYPRYITERPDRFFFYQNYISTYVERDVRQIVNIKDAALFHRFLVLCAGRIGSILDYTSLSNDCGINVRTAKEWLSILEASFIGFTLNPWYMNRTKRLIKSPKFYFYDTGLACALLGIAEESQLNRDPLRGNLFENLVILERMKRSFNCAEQKNFWYYRTSDGKEIDLVEETGRILTPFEIKSSETFNSEFVKNFGVFEKEYPEMCGEKTVVYAGKESFEFKGVQVKNFRP